MNITFEKAYLNYLEYAKLRQKPTSIIALDRKIKMHVLPYFKNKKIKKITVQNYLDWQIEMQKKELKYGYKRNIHYCMCAIYNYLGMFQNIKNIPKIAGNFKEDFYFIESKREIWSIEEYKKFITAVDNKIYKILFKFLFETGCRKSEALALTFNDIVNNCVSINKSISKDCFNGKRIILTPKTKKSIRKIQIDSSLMNDINFLREYYSKKFNNYNSNFLIFGGLKPISCTTLERKKNFYCDKAKVKRIRIHDFRHSNATFLYENNISVQTIANRLGHSSIRTTLDTYIHQYDNNEKRVLELLSSLEI